MRMCIIFALLAIYSYSNTYADIRFDSLGVVSERKFESTKYRYYIPFTAGTQTNQPLPVLVLIAGKNHDPQTYIERWIQVAEKERIILIAPYFDTEEFSDYGKLNFKKNRADLRLILLLDDANSICPVDPLAGVFYLFNGPLF